MNVATALTVPGVTGPGPVETYCNVSGMLRLLPLLPLAPEVPTSHVPGLPETAVSGPKLTRVLPYLRICSLTLPALEPLVRGQLVRGVARIGRVTQDIKARRYAPGKSGFPVLRLPSSVLRDRRPAYRSRSASRARLNGLIRYWNTVLLPVLISVVVTMPGMIGCRLPSLVSR